MGRHPTGPWRSACFGQVGIDLPEESFRQNISAAHQQALRTGNRQMYQLCHHCHLAYRQETAPRRIGRGTTTVELPSKSFCFIAHCKCNSWGFPICLACALESQVCQKCRQPLPCDIHVREATARCRRLLSEAIAAAQSQYQQTTASMSSEIARLEKAMQRAEKAYLTVTDEAVSKYARFQEAASLASQRLWRRDTARNLRRYRSAEKKRKRAEGECHAVFDQAIQARREALEMAISAFPKYAIYDKAKNDRREAIQQAQHAFLAAVQSILRSAVTSQN